MLLRMVTYAVRDAEVGQVKIKMVTSSVFVMVKLLLVQLVVRKHCMTC